MGTILAVAGVASFSGLAVNVAGVYTLTASTQDLTDAPSNLFRISASSDINSYIYLPVIYKN